MASFQWSEVDRILKLDASDSHHHVHLSSLSSPPPNFYNPSSPSSSSTKWTDPYSLYDDVCLLCATL